MLTQGTSAQPFHYAGEQRDSESGFMYLRERMYEPTIGRFLQRDAFAGVPLLPASLNRFGYAFNNPATRVDPSGRAPNQRHPALPVGWSPPRDIDLPYLSAPPTNFAPTIAAVTCFLPFAGGNPQVFEQRCTYGVSFSWPGIGDIRIEVHAHAGIQMNPPFGRPVCGRPASACVDARGGHGHHSRYFFVQPDLPSRDRACSPNVHVRRKVR